MKKKTPVKKPRLEILYYYGCSGDQQKEGDILGDIETVATTIRDNPDCLFGMVSNVKCGFFLPDDNFGHFFEHLDFWVIWRPTSKYKVTFPMIRRAIETIIHDENN